MKVFLSWSGLRSRGTAEYLATWLPTVVQAVEPWISTAIEKGTRGNEEINQALEGTGLGVICITRDNLDSTWIHFEAGALARSHDRVWTLLLDVAHADVAPPLSQFQHTVTSRDDVWKLVQSINRRVAKAGEQAASESALQAVFERFWPDLEAKLAEIAASTVPRTPVRSERVILEEVLELVRQLRGSAVTIYRAGRSDINASGVVSMAGFFDSMRMKLGASHPDDRLGQLFLDGSGAEAERFADRLVADRLVAAAVVDASMAGFPIVTFASAPDVSPKDVVEFADRVGMVFHIAYPATDRLKAEARQLVTENPVK